MHVSCLNLLWAYVFRPMSRVRSEYDADLQPEHAVLQLSPVAACQGPLGALPAVVR